MEESAAPNLQNEFFNKGRREKSRVAVFLNSGKKLTGRIKSFDRFTILLETSQGEQMIFKHAIATVGPMSSGMSAKPRGGFNNRMDLGVASGSTGPGSAEEPRQTVAPSREGEGG